MVRYPPEHKIETRERILVEAGKLFRRHGYDGVGIETIMEAAQLTRGGFYAHFKSKADLFAAVLAREPDFERRVREAQQRQPAGSIEGLKQTICDYMAPGHLERVVHGCVLASLAIDARRAEPDARAAFTETLRRAARETSRHLADADEIDPRALSALALTVGGAILARACDDEELRNRILETCRDDALRRVEGPKNMVCV